MGYLPHQDSLNNIVSIMVNQTVLVLVFDKVHSLLCENSDLNSLFDNVHIKSLSGFSDLEYMDQYQLLGGYGHVYVLSVKGEHIPDLLSRGIFQVRIDLGYDELSGIIDASLSKEYPIELADRTLLFFLQSRIASFLMEIQKNEVSALREKASSFSFALETIRTVSAFESESEAINFTRDFFEMMCMPENIVYYGIDDISSLSRDFFLIDFTLDEILNFIEAGNEYLFSSSKESYCFRIFSHNGDKGIFIIEKVAYPERISECLNLALSINKVLSITLENIDNTGKLKESNRMLSHSSDLLRIINKILRHDLLNNLGAIQMSLEMNDQHSNNKYIDLSKKAVKKSIKTIKDMKDLESLIGSSDPLKLYDVDQTLCNVLETDIGIDVSVTGNCQIRADGALPSVFENIIKNARFHGKATNMAIYIKQKDGKNYICLSDNGSGIKEEMRTRIFEEGVSTGGGDHSGLGLYIVKKVIERYGGSVRVEENQPTGATFILELPVV